MADRYKFQFSSALVPGVVSVDGYVATGSSGAVLNTAAGTNLNAAGLPLYLPKGVLSITRNSTGKYTIALGSPNTQASVSGVDTYWDLLSCKATPVCPSATDIKDQVVSWNLTSPGGSPGSTGQYMSSLVIQFVNSSGSAVDPPNGGGFLLHIKLKNSSVV